MKLTLDVCEHAAYMFTLASLCLELFLNCSLTIVDVALYHHPIFLPSYSA